MQVMEFSLQAGITVNMPVMKISRRSISDLMTFPGCRDRGKKGITGQDSPANDHITVLHQAMENNTVFISRKITFVFTVDI